MTHPFSQKTHFTLAVFATLSLSGAASADVTGAQVWADWTSYFSGFGYEITGTEAQTGNRLIVSDIQTSTELPEEDATFTMTMGTLTFLDNGDGTVTVEMPEVMPLGINVTSDDDDAVTATVEVQHSGQSLIVSGEENDLTYTHNADSMTISLAEINVEGDDVPAELFNITIRMTDLSSVVTSKLDDLRRYTQNMTAAELTYAIDFDVPEDEGGGKVDVSGAMQAISATSSGETPTETDIENPAAMLSAGLNLLAGFTYDSGNSVINIESPEGTVAGTTSSAGGTLEFAMNADGLRYDVSQNDVVVDMQSLPEVPFPVSLSMVRAAFNLAVPLSPSDEDQDFALGFTMGDFKITDAIWNIVDPAGQLPRDPATIALDLTGKAKVLMNFMDPEQAAQMEQGVAPGELSALDINDLRVSAVGANLSGKGGFTFDNTDMSTFPGMPKPTGALDIRVEGANGLMDRLVNMGLMPQEQAMGARMMMGLFGVPQGDDVLTSKIEVNDQGHVLANGQRLQ